MKKYAAFIASLRPFTSKIFLSPNRVFERAAAHSTLSPTAPLDKRDSSDLERRRARVAARVRNHFKKRRAPLMPLRERVPILRAKNLFVHTHRNKR